MKLYKVYCVLTPEKFEIKAKELGAEEKAKTYKVNDPSIWGRQMLRKDELMKVDTGSVRRFIYNHIYYRTYCLEQDVEKAKEIVEYKVLDDFKKMFEDMDKMHDLYLDIYGHM